MKTTEEQIELANRIVASFDLVYQRLIEYKKYKKSVLVVMEGDKIVHKNPFDL
ncbi:MAG: hypothetical protein K1X54_10580 [Flavobacteriales bacterium]|jgi:hypothetical protein|nr:hypothetical protein [Flavobacteriales bacterium]MBX7052469.1 hypothetical protein [Flavobacteriales bacterium]